MWSARRTNSFSLRPDRKPLLIALAIAAGVHLILIYAFVSLAVLALMFSDQAALADLHRLIPARTNLASPTEPTLIFVDVDPSQISREPPKNPKFYSSQSTVAANPDAKVETETPKIDGSQTHVPKTETTPRTKAFPLQPTPPPEPVPEKVADTKPKSDQKPGDLALGKPNEPKPDEATQPHVRPRTLAQAMAQNPIAGEKSKVDGGVKNRRIVPTFDTVGTAFGEYDARIIAAIQQHWYDLVDSQAVSRDRTGRVVLEFRLNFDGRISDMKEIENNVGPSLVWLCRRAIEDPSPYERWPAEMRRTIGNDYREVRFTFYYE